MSETRERLLRAAERLFATKGIDGTVVRDVNALAGQRNTSAIRYHFDGMQGLLESLVALRMGGLDAARADALGTLIDSSDASVLEVEDFVAVLVLPLATRVDEDEGWACWVRVLAQLISVRGHEHRPLWEGRFDRTTREVFMRIRAWQPEIPEPVWLQRVDDVMLLCIGSICERVRRVESGAEATHLDAAAFSKNLIATATALLRAPVES